MTRPPGTPAAEDLRVAARLFGQRLELAEHYARLLAGDGVRRGLLGPTEGPRVWSRHLLNCAAIGEVFPEGARVVDVGSGAGLPGLALAIARPDLRVDLVEPLLRRAQFLTEAVAELGLSESVRVVRGRAEEALVREQLAPTEWVTARAVAPLDRLVRWCLPLLAVGGRLVAIKGETAFAEIALHRDAVRRLGGVEVRLVECGMGVVSPPVPVITVRRAPRLNQVRRVRPVRPARRMGASDE